MFQKKKFLRVFLVFLTKVSRIFSELKQKTLDEIRQSNSIKLPNIDSLKIFWKILPHKGNFCLKVSSKIKDTFYLKNHKYPFCAPIFHPIPETEYYLI